MAAVWNNEDERVINLDMLSFPWGTDGREGLVLNFFSVEKRPLAMARYNERLAQEAVQEFNQGVLNYMQHGHADAPVAPVNDQEDEVQGPGHGRWSLEEKIAFVRGVHALGRDWAGIAAAHVHTRDGKQVRGHSLNRAYEFFLHHY